VTDTASRAVADTAPRRGANMALHRHGAAAETGLASPAFAPAGPGPGAALQQRRRRRTWLHGLNQAAILLLVLGPLIVYPLARLVWLSLDSEHGVGLQAYRSFFSNPETRGVLGATLAILGTSAGLASLLGVSLAALLFFKPFPGARLLTRFLELFVAFPSFLVAFTLIFLYGSQGSIGIAAQHLFGLSEPPFNFLFGSGGVILAEVIFYTPFVVRPTLASFALLDMRLLEAARSLGAGLLTVAWRVVLPGAWPGIAAGVILCFLLTLNEFGILLVLGSAHLVTLPVAIYAAATVDLDLPVAAAGAVTMLAMSLALYAVYRRLNRRAG
jgi:2-aminoethylphosphonate transport system permease protein